MNRGTAFLTKLYVRPANTQISLRIHTFCSDFAWHWVGNQGSIRSAGGQQSDCADLSLRWDARVIFNPSPAEPGYILPLQTV